MQKQNFAIKTKLSLAASLENKASSNGTIRGGEYSTKEALKSRSKFDSLKNSVERLLSARSQNKQNIESKTKILHKTEESLSMVEELVADLSKTKIRLEAISQSEEGRLERLKERHQQVEKKMEGLVVDLNELSERNKLGKEVIASLREKVSHDQRCYEIYMDFLQNVQEDNRNQEDQLSRVNLQREEREKRKNEVESELKLKHEQINGVNVKMQEVMEIISKKQSEINEILMLSSQVSKQIATIQKQQEELGKECQVLESKIKSKEEELIRNQNETKKLNDIMAELESALSEFRQSREEMKFKEKFEILMRKNNLQFEGVDTSKISYLAQKKQLKQKCLTDLKTKCEQLENKKKGIDNNVNEMENKAQSLEEELTSMKSRMEQRREEFSATDALVKDLKQEAINLKREIEEKSVSLQNINNEICKVNNNSKQRTHQNTVELSDLRQQLHLKSEEVNQLCKKLQDLEQREQEELKNLEKLDLELNQSVADMKSAENRLDEKKRELESKKSSLALLQEQLNLLRDQDRRHNSILSEKQILIQKLAGKESKKDLVRDFEKEFERLSQEMNEQLEKFSEDLSLKYKQKLERESQKNIQKKLEREQRFKELEERYARTLEGLDSEIDELQSRIEKGSVDDIVPKSKPKPIVVEPMSQPLLSIDFADDLFSENTTSKEKTFDFFDDDY